MNYKIPMYGFHRLRERLNLQTQIGIQRALTELPDDVIAFNQVIGNPISPKTNLPHELTSYQIDIAEYPGKDLIVNKSNKIGVTEIFLRDMIYKAVKGDCRGYDLLLGSSELLLAVENMRRLQLIFFNSPLLRPLVKEAIVSRMVLTDNTRFLVMPASPQALRSWPRVKYEFLDEAAHQGVLDDSEYIAAATGRLANTAGWLRIASTPRGQRGYFFDWCMKAKRGEIKMLYQELPYYVGLGTFFDQEYIDKEKGRLGNLFNQEYLCAFISAQTAAIESELIDDHLQRYPVERW
jgi:hypothetical protein